MFVQDTGSRISFVDWMRRYDESSVFRNFLEKGGAAEVQSLDHSTEDNVPLLNLLKKAMNKTASSESSIIDAWVKEQQDIVMGNIQAPTMKDVATAVNTGGVVQDQGPAEGAVSGGE
jgi:hypothetical protein